MPDSFAVIAIVVSAISGLIGVLGGIVAARYSWRKDRREQEEHDDSQADRTIELLKEQNTILIAQHAEALAALEAREAEWRKREVEWQRREKALDSRVHDIERDYRNLVLTVTSMGFCANSATCSNYNPGDRRARITETDKDTA